MYKGGPQDNLENIVENKVRCQLTW